MESPFYQSPGTMLCPGDIFLDVPFPSLKHPLTFYRRSPSAPGKRQDIASVFHEEKGDVPKDGDTAHGPFTKRTVILVSHECELDGVDRDVKTKATKYDRRYWLAAPVFSFKELTSTKMKERIALGQQPNKMFLPPGGPLGDIPHFTDFRKITSITVPYFQTAKRLSSLSPDGMLALQAHLCLFFSGLVFYVQPVDCPHCNQPIDPRTFVMPSSVEEDID